MSERDDVAEAVLDAARSAYAARGFLGTTIKSVAAAAGVAPDVVRNYYSSREDLFAAAMRLPSEPRAAVAALLAPGMDGMGERLARATLRLFADPATRQQLLDLVRAGSTAAGATSSLRDFIEATVIDRVAGALGVPDARMRVSLAVSYLLGVGTAKYVLRLEPLASASDAEVVRMVAPAVQAALTGQGVAKPPRSEKK